jgi:hypothetical protein
MDAKVDFAPSRTTRMAYDPVEQGKTEVVWRATNCPRGDEFLVDTSAYGLPGLHWCEVVGVATGSASVYPYKVDIPNRGVGQYRASEVQGWRRPLVVHELLRICRLEVARRG